MYARSGSRHIPVGRINWFRCCCSVLAIAILLGWSARSNAQIITEFRIPSPVAPGQAQGITTGPDGALWFTLLGSIGRVTPAGAFTLYSPKASEGGPVTANGGITAGPDGALWFTEGTGGTGGKVGRITAAGAVTGFSIAKPVAGVGAIAAGSDGALWFVNTNSAEIGRITTSGTVTEYPLPAGFTLPTVIAAGPDGALWFTNRASANLGTAGFAQIGRITTSGGIIEFPTPDDDGAIPDGITAGPDGAVWFVKYSLSGGVIGRITTSGGITEFSVPSGLSSPRAIASGPDGALWVTDVGTNSIDRATTAGMVTVFPIPTSGSFPTEITAGPDGAMWFTKSSPEPGKIGRITTPLSTHRGTSDFNGDGKSDILWQNTNGQIAIGR